MKRLVFILLLLLVTIAKSQSNSGALENPLSNEFWSEHNGDKTNHFLASYAVSATTYLVLSKKNSKYNHLSAFQKRSIVFATTIVFGLLKETYDSTRKNKSFDKNDVMANFIGASAFQVTITIPLHLKKKKDTRLTKP